jgi:hypothetical protein
MKKKEGKREELPPPSGELVRLNLSVLPSEQDKIVEFQGKCKRPHRLFNQSEVLRAGLYALTILDSDQLKEVADSVPQL